MRLSLEALQNREFFDSRDIAIPTFNYEEVAARTLKSPQWIHFGAGNIFRGFVAKAYQSVLNKGLAHTGIVAVESFDFEIIEKIYKPYDNLSLLALMRKEGSLDTSIVGSITESLTTKDKGWLQLVPMFENSSLQMVSFTITEKGYSLRDVQGNYFPFVQKDLEDFDNPTHTVSIVTQLLYRRFQKAASPLALVSMDNCSRNGDLLRSAVITIAKEWVERGFVSAEFLSYVQDTQQVAFPLSMIDKITPRPAPNVQSQLESLGFESLDIVVTDKNTYIAPFVNAEVCEYLVIEDAFPNGRPALEEGGIIFTDRETVNRVETMKVTTCLNPLHTALAVMGCVMGYDSIAAEMRDPVLVKLVHRIADEGLKVVEDPRIIRPQDFVKEVLEERFPNPNIPDTPQRIATDTSLKVGIRFGETIKRYISTEELHPEELVGIPLAIAAWLRYIMGVDLHGNPFQVSPDPRLGELQEILRGVSFGGNPKGVGEILGNKAIFGVDLYKTGLGSKIEGYFAEMLASPEAIIGVCNTHL